MSEKFNKLLVIIDCYSPWGRPIHDRPTTEATYAFMMDVEPADKSAPRSVVLSEIFDSPAFRVYSNPALKRRKTGRGTPWMENRFNTDYHREVSSDPDYDAMNHSIHSRFNDLVRRAWEVKVKVHSASMKQSNLDFGGPSKESSVFDQAWELVPYHFVDFSYIRESRDSLPNGRGHVTMVHCTSVSDVFVAYVKYAAHTSLGKHL